VEGKIVKRHGKFVQLRRRYSSNTKYVSRDLSHNEGGLQFGELMPENEREALEVAMAEKEAAKKAAEEREKQRVEAEQEALGDIYKRRQSKDESVWFYNDRNGERHRCSLKDIPNDYKLGKIRTDTYLYSGSGVFKNLTSWTKLRDFPELQEYIDDKLYGNEIAALDFLATAAEINDGDYKRLAKPKPATPKKVTVTMRTMIEQMRTDWDYISSLYLTNICPTELHMITFNNTINEITKVNPEKTPAQLLPKRKVTFEI